MLFNRRKKNRSLLKAKLLEEAKKERYKLQLMGHVKELEVKYDKYHKMALQSKVQNNKESMDHGIRQSLLVQNHIHKLKELIGYIEKIETDADVKELYDEFIDQLKDYTDNFKEKRSRKRKTKKALKKHRKEIVHVGDYFEMIDKRIEKINKTMSKSITETKPLSEKEVNHYFTEDM